MRRRGDSSDPPDPASYAEVSRSQVHAPLASGSTEQYIFARRKPKERGSKPKFYFFTPDEDTLLLAATVKKIKSRTHFKISASSKDIKKKSPCYLGLCSEGAIKKAFTGYKVFPAKPTAFLTAVKILTDAEPEQVLLPPRDKPDYAFPDSPDIPLPTDVTTLTCIREREVTQPTFEHIRLVLQEELIMSIKQTGVEEFQIQIGAPMSVYQAFCVACVLTPS
jgi:hypothetical protein